MVRVAAPRKRAGARSPRLDVTVTYVPADEERTELIMAALVRLALAHLEASRKPASARCAKPIRETRAPPGAA